MRASSLKGRRIGILGLGISGIGSYIALKEAGAKVIVWDENQESRAKFLSKMLYKFNRLVVENSIVDTNSGLWHDLDYIIFSPGIATNFPKPHKLVEIAKKYNIKIICDIEVMSQSDPYNDIIAITGTNGKSTVTQLTSHILKTAEIPMEVGGNIGNSALSLSRLRVGGKYIIECSSYQLELIDKFKPKVALLLNLAINHTDRYKNLNDYINAKLNIFRNQNQDDYIVINYDNELTREIYYRLLSSKKFKKVIPFSVKTELSNGAYIKNGQLYYKKFLNFKLPNNWFLKGEHNKENILASVIAAHCVGVDSEKSLIKAIESFVGLKHRMEYLGTKSGVAYINDSKATNMIAVQKAINAFKDISWIAGGWAKGEADFSLLENKLSNIKKAFLIGEATEKIALFLDKYKIPYKKCDNLKKAFEDATTYSLGKGVVLMSPGFPSFDQFKNFAERGETFRKLYNKL